MDTIEKLVEIALQEDIGTGDITAQLIPADTHARAHIIVREAAVICGIDYAQAVFQQVDAHIQPLWLVKEGESLEADQVLCELQGPARSLLTAERTALNFLQTLSAIASRTAYFKHLIKDTSAQILDTRKTLPGLRVAQKYAVKIGGGVNHRLGLFDVFLIKENHIAAAGSIAQAVQAAHAMAADKKIVVEVENFAQLNEAIQAGVQHIMLDNFTTTDIAKAVADKPAHVQLEASGGIDANNIQAIAQTGVDFISLGTLTKDIQAVDLSMRFV